MVAAKKKSKKTAAGSSLVNQSLTLRLKKSVARTHTATVLLKTEIIRRKTAETALKKSEEHHTAMLDQALLMQERLRRLTHQVISAQEEERREISRELHDDIAQTLTGINVRLINLKREAILNTKGLKGKISHAQRLVEKSVQIVQRFARELRPALLDDLGLIPALNSYINGLMQRTKLTIKMASFPELEYLDLKKRTALYRVAREALTNVVRHAQATNVQIVFQKLRKMVLMRIKDNGRAFDVENVLFSKRNKRLGVLGMRERVEMVGGTFTIKSTPGEGTVVWAEIPFITDKKPKENQ